MLNFCCAVRQVAPRDDNNKGMDQGWTKDGY